MGPPLMLGAFVTVVGCVLFALAWLVALAVVVGQIGGVAIALLRAAFNCEQRSRGGRE